MRERRAIEYSSSIVITRGKGIDDYFKLGSCLPSD